MPRPKKDKVESIEGLKITISHDQKSIVKESVQLEKDDMVLIMPKYQPMTFKKKLYWFANILYRYWN